MRKIARLFFILSVLIAPQLVAGTVYYVATNGNDSYNGLYPSYQAGSNGPFRTLNHAANVLSPGDTLKIRGGTYQEKINWSRSGNAGSRITITNYNDETVIIDGGYALPGGSVYYFLVTVSGNYVTLQNVTIKRSSGSLLALSGNYIYAINVIGEGSRETGIVAGGAYNRLDGCTMTDNGNGYGLSGQGTWGSAICTVGDNTTIQNCIAYENRGEGINAYSDSTNAIIQDNIAYNNRSYNLYLDSADGAIVRRNIVYQTKSNYQMYGITIGAETGQPLNLSIYNNLVMGCLTNFHVDSNVVSLTNVKVAYNTFVNSVGGITGYTMGVYFRPNINAYSNSIFKNNIVIEEAPDRVPVYVEAAHPGLTFSNNCWNKTPLAAAQGSLDIITNPLLLKAGPTGPGSLTAEWFRIQAGSPAQDRAQVLGDVTEDFFKTPRGSNPDMGAHELSSGPPPLTASTTGSPTSGLAPLTVNFTGGAAGGTSPYSYRWTFGDGTSSTSQNPSHTYSSSGSYIATLTVTDSASSTAASTVHISATAGVPLSANIGASPTSGLAPLTVNFTGSASGGASPYSYRWTFGDGSSSTAQSPSHTYASAGSYAAILMVTDSSGTRDTKSISISVTSAASGLTVSASASPTSGQAPLAVEFTGSVSGGTPPYSFGWDFRDGHTSTTQNTSHTYSAPGSYEAILTVTDQYSSTSSSTIVISVTTQTAFSFSLASETGAPAQGTGGTTDPPPGNYSYGIGSTVSVKSLPNAEYRFSKWTGDISEAGMFFSQADLTLDNDKAILATFCAKCADVNGDLKITPADAQLAFDIYLRRVAEPTWCELENADVNCSGTKLTPKITPADAQTIFHKYLRRGVASSDCSGNSRKTEVSAETEGFINANLTIDKKFFASGQDILIPIIIESPSQLSAFGFDLAFPSDSLTFVGLEGTELTEDYNQLDANVIPYDPTSQETANAEPSKIHILRVGGYKTDPIEGPSTGILVTLVFRRKGPFVDSDTISIIATYDDLQKASFGSRTSNRQDSPQIREDARFDRKAERMIKGKRSEY